MRRKKKNIILERVLVEDYAAEGKSIARVDGKVVFIEKVVPGDVVDVKLSKSKKDWAEGYPLQFHSFSEERTEPFCQHFGVCGGCQWQMLPYDKQLFYKRRQVEDNLKRIGKIDLPQIPPVVGCDKTKWYRNKLEYTFSSKRFIPAHTKPPPTGEASIAQSPPLENSNLLSEFSSRGVLCESNSPPLVELEGAGASGFHAKGLFDKVVEIERCWLQAEPTNIVRKTITDFGRKNNYSFYDHKLHTGFLRTVLLRICSTGEVMVNIVMGEDDESKRNLLLEHLLKEVPGITTLLYTINTKWNDSLHDLNPVIVTGKGFVIETLENLQFKIGPKSFFQTNTTQAEKLYSIARDYASLSGSETVYDLYCGTGSIGIFVSKLAKKIIGVDMIADAIADARENAALNNIHHAQFFEGDVIRVCDDDFFAAHGKPDVIITDPPRAGMHEKLVKKMLEMAAPIVVYVSCNPATQARDLRLLDERYHVTKVQPVDMFPHTHHIENVVQLKLTG
ncbi:MAG TPA: 23S rRNA (uracil(1939)-C(5))-methyltransferase RlmD [Chitinophagaceae bacterium]|nr:23S rRNA (uracil(1939)-C(5))-methyltransferase RlmD [Chitinophagaceae bacterium]